MHPTNLRVQRINKLRFALYTLLLVVFILLFSSCAKKPNEQELQRLENARKAAELAEAKLESVKKERLALEEELAIKKKTLEDKEIQVEKAKVNSGN